MDGAIILAADASRIARANVHLMPKASIPTTETGTRHRTAERVARSIDVPVMSVSAAMSVVAVYRNDRSTSCSRSAGCTTGPARPWPPWSASGAGSTSPSTGLSALEMEDTVTVRDVAAVLQPAEMVVRIADEVDGYLVELGDDGRLLRLQLEELLDGVARLAAPGGPRLPAGTASRAAGRTSGPTSTSGLASPAGRLTTDELSTPAGWPSCSAPARLASPTSDPGRAPRLPAPAPAAALSGRDHRRDRGPLRRPAADHAGVAG